MTDRSLGRVGVGVGVELEAAEALAALSHHIISTAVDEYGSLNQPLKNTNESERTPHDRSEVLRKNTNTISSMMVHSKRADKEFNRMNCRVHLSSTCVKSRNHVTEEEREERRIRRVLANRESARQTIRRRQAMYEQLTKTAAVMEMENENLKTEKEKVLSKFNSLKSMNERLKDLLDKATKAKGIREECCDSDLGSTKPSTAPIVLCNQPSVVPFFWPPFLHPSDVDSEQRVHTSNGMGTLAYVVPFPWIFPIQMQCIAQSSAQCSEPAMQYIQCPEIQNEAQAEGQMEKHPGTSSPEEGKMEKHHASYTAKINSEITNVTLPASGDCGFSVIPDTTGKHTVESMAFKGTMALKGTTSYCTGTLVSSLATPQDPQEEDMVEMEAVSPSAWSLATKSEVSIRCPSKKSVGGGAAAEARRRRKELTKLKRLYCRNRMR